ncbi:MAG: LuxN [Chloroflexi bacterium]|nr:LuxN [Chloroflexota bacterium]
MKYKGRQLDSTILFVEDQADIRSVLSTFLEMLGYKVIQVTNGAEGLEAFKKTPSDLVITDINMPVMNGNEFIAALAALPQPPPVIALSGDSWEVISNPIIKSVISKPISIHTLKQVVKDLLPNSQ